MKSNFRFIVYLAVLTAHYVAALDDLQSIVPNANPDADKSQYTLVDRTPQNLLRDIDTDRGDKTNSPITVDAGHFQLEAGLFSYIHYRNNSNRIDYRTDVRNFGEFNLRMGVLNNLELNIATTAYTSVHTEILPYNLTRRASGSGDLFVGGKLNFWGNDSEDCLWKTAFAIQPQFKIPTASCDVGNGRFEWSVALPFSVKLPLDFQLGFQTTPGCERNSANSRTIFSVQNSMSLNHSIPCVKGLDAYVELWSHMANDPHSREQASINFGAIYKITRNLALDTGVNLSPSKHIFCTQVFTGLTVRF